MTTGRGLIVLVDYLVRFPRGGYAWQAAHCLLAYAASPTPRRESRLSSRIQDLVNASRLTREPGLLLRGRSPRGPGPVKRNYEHHTAAAPHLAREYFDL
jgi:hypothetical protein